MAGYDYDDNTRQRLECLDCTKVFASYPDAEKHKRRTGHKVKYNEVAI